jgi:hypothetical protein
MQRRNLWMVVIVIVASLQLAACAGQASAPKPKNSPSKVETIEGSSVKRVVLTEKAAARLDIQTAPVEESNEVREWTVGGQVAALPKTGGVMLVRVPLSESELSRIDRSKSAFVLPLDDAEDGEEEAEGLEAEEADSPDDADPEDDAVYYAVKEQGQKVTAEGQPVRVKLTLKSNGAPLKTVPYAAVIYDVAGKTWVYTNPEPLTFVRQSITVDYVEDGVAHLTDGPAVGTKVVTIGGAELHGAETGVSK